MIGGKRQTEYEASVSTRHALAVIIPLCLLAILLSFALISAANDVYAFVKPDNAVTVTVSSPMSAKQFSSLLRESGVIKDDLVFSLYLHSKGKDDDVSLLTGEWLLNSNMSYRDILLKIF
jgi:cell division protein YceG involved in septum cleavage